MGEIGELSRDEQDLIFEYRRVKALRHGDLIVSVKNEEMVKLWVTTQTTKKIDLDGLRNGKKLMEVTPNDKACN
jgi:hypothetical protein